MLKRRLAEFDANVHAQVIAFGKGQNKGNTPMEGGKATFWRPNTPDVVWLGCPMRYQIPVSVTVASPY